MLNVKNYGNTTKLAKAIGAAEQEVSVSTGDGSKLAVVSGDYFYATIRYNGVREFVKVVARNNDVLTVVRGQDNTTAQSFPKGACVEVEWNPKQLCEYVTACVNGDTVSGLNGVHCIECGSCLTLDGGKITKINGETSC